MAFKLVDDGTLDTLVRCEDCGEEVRYYTDVSFNDPDCEAEKSGDLCGCYGRFRAWALRSADSNHDCLVSEEEK